MGQTKSNTPLVNPLTQTIEGDTIWDEAILGYWFAVAADKSDTEADTIVGGAFTNPTLTPNTEKADYDPLDAADAGENIMRLAFIEAAAAFSNITNIGFQAAVSFDAADLKIVGASNYQSMDLSGTVSSNYGSMNFPGTNLDGFFAPLTGEYESFLLLNKSLAIMTQAPVTGGGHFSLSVLLHELGHGLGLGHPHDNGGTTTILPGALKGGIADVVPLDNQRYTIMSYESGGLDKSNPGTSGHAVTPMALDIAALHSMYGTKAFNTTNTTYTLTDAGSAALDVTGPTISIGEAFYSIWDTGGSGDVIQYAGSKDTVINLNDATLSRTDDATTLAWISVLKSTTAFANLSDEMKVDLTDADYHAGGFFSRVINGGTPQLGGYSIANGVLIENAIGGGGADIIVGNELDNSLNGHAGDDVFVGSAGDDTIDGGAGMDIVVYTENCDNYEIEKDTATGVVTIRHIGGTMTDGADTLTGIESAKFAGSEIDLTVDDPGCPPIDFIFLVDLSGSYDDDLPNFQAAAPAIASLVRSMDPNAKFAVSSFIDLPISPYGAPGDYPYRPELALTDDAAAFQAAIAGLSTRDGGDYPESQWFGLDRAARGIGLNLRDNSRKIILIATDATSHDAADYGVDEAGLLQFLDDNDIDTIGGSTGWEVADPTDVGPGAVYDDGITDPLFRSFLSAAGIASATPIFAITSGAENYYEGFSSFFPGGAPVVPLSSAGDDISDAVSAALAEISGDVTRTGSSLDDVLDGTPNGDGLFGLGGDDTLRGFGDDDILDGGSGDDRIEGGDGEDVLRGGTGRDMLFGDTGNDTLEGGLGGDSLEGGDGNDQFRGALDEFFGDAILDFNELDKIVFANETLSRAQIKFIASSAIMGIDANRDGAEDGSFTLEGDFTRGDFMAVVDGNDTILTFETFLPVLKERQAVDPALVNGIINQDFLKGDGSTDFIITLRDLGFAGYNNVVGVYEIDSSGSIVDTRMLFANANSDKVAQATITGVESGNRLGFFIVQDAADWAATLAGGDTFSFVNDLGAPATISDGASIHLAVNGAITDEIVFHSFAGTMNSDGVQHVLSGVDVGGESILIGFEDLTGGGDRDYEDVAFRVELF